MKTFNPDDYKMYDNPIVILLSRQIELNLAVINDHYRSIIDYEERGIPEGEVSEYDYIIAHLKKDIEKRKIDNMLFEQMVKILAKENDSG